MKEGLNDQVVRRVWRHSVLPYVGERFFGDPDRLGEFDLDRLRRSAAKGQGPGEEERGAANGETGETEEPGVP